MNNISDRVKSCISLETIANKEEVTETATLSGDLMLDELDIACLALTLEDRFGISINSDDLQPLKTVQDVIDYVCKRMEG